MALSEKAEKALKDVKNSLYILYGAEYFTEEEWIKIDFLIHKGKYMLTNGPPIASQRNILEQQFEPLMVFEDSKEPIVSVLQIADPKTITKEGIETAVVQEEQVSGPDSSDGDFVASHTETPNETSAESSSDEENPAQSSEQQEDTSQITTPLSAVALETPKNGLLAGYTQEQLDEVKAFNATLSKKGNRQKSRQSYTPMEEEAEPSGWVEEVTETAREYQFSSPASTEREDRISCWASEVDAAETRSNASLNPAKTTLAERFANEHGRRPKSSNSSHQANNSQHSLGSSSKRPKSRASTKSIRTIQRSTTPATPIIPEQFPIASNKSVSKRLRLEVGSIYEAKESQSKTSKIVLEVKLGELITVLSHVSGLLYYGRNMTTKEQGHFSMTIVMSSEKDKPVPFQKSAGHKVAGQKLAMEQAAAWDVKLRTSEDLAATRMALDQVENTNAAAWDEVPVRRSTRPAQNTAAVIAPRAMRTNAGLASSRFSVLESLGNDGTSEHRPENFTPAMQAEFGKLVDKKFQEILHAHGMSSASTTPKPPSGRAAKKINTPLKPVPLKKDVCWFWRTGKGCRFTAEECRDLHYYPEGTADSPSNLHMGKPTWGAAADYTPTSPTAQKAGVRKVKTCYYWATEGKCRNAVEDCRFLHDYTGEGVAPAPPGWVAKRRENWKNAANREGEEGAVEGQVVAESWGQSGAWGEDKYKPPHVVDMEDKARKEAVGW